MRKTINIGGKDFNMKSSAYTQFAYKNETGRSLLGDMNSLSKLDLSEENFEVLDSISDMVLKMAYVMALEDGTNEIKNYEEFLKGIDNLYDDQTWIEEVITLATSPLSRRLQENQNNQQQ